MDYPQSYQSSENSPTSVDFWVKEALELRKVAELCWVANKKVHERNYFLQKTATPQSGLQEIADAELELNLMYRYLISLSVQYFAIGILVARNPERFLREAPQYHFTSLVEECGIELNKTQYRILKNIENSFGWGEKKPFLDHHLSLDELQGVVRHGLIRMSVAAEEKKELDALLEEMKKLISSYVEKSL